MNRTIRNSRTVAHRIGQRLAEALLWSLVCVMIVLWAGMAHAQDAPIVDDPCERWAELADLQDQRIAQLKAEVSVLAGARDAALADVADRDARIDQLLYVADEAAQIGDVYRHAMDDLRRQSQRRHRLTWAGVIIGGLGVGALFVGVVR